MHLSDDGQSLTWKAGGAGMQGSMCYILMSIEQDCAGCSLTPIHLIKIQSPSSLNVNSDGMVGHSGLRFPVPSTAPIVLLILFSVLMSTAPTV